jgi:hypothetical protein
MASLRFPFWVAVTSVAMVAGLLFAGTVLARTAYAGPSGGFGFGGPPWAHKGGFATHGTVTAASPTDLTVQLRDGSTATFAVGDQVVVLNTKDGHGRWGDSR